MNKTLEKLNAEFEKIAEIVEKREETFESRSEKWQESDAGIKYQEKTAELEDIECNLQEVVEALTDWINN